MLQQLARVFQAELEFEVDYAEGDDDVDEDDEDTYIDIDSDDEYDDIDIYDSDGRTDHYEDSEKGPTPDVDPFIIYFTYQYFMSEAKINMT